MSLWIALLSLQIIACWCGEHEKEIKSEGSMQLLAKIKTDLFVDGVDPVSPATSEKDVDIGSEERDKKIVTAVEEVSEEESSLVWQLYGMANECHRQYRKVAKDLWEEMRLAIQDNPRVLQSTRLIAYERPKGYKPTQLLRAFAQLLNGLNVWHNPESYVTMFFNLVGLDTDNDRRIKALEVFIEGLNIKHATELIKKGTDMSISQLPILAIISDCYVEKTLSGQSWIEVGQSTKDKLLKKDELPKKVFHTICRDLQLKKLQMARMLVDEGASLEAIGPTFPPKDHARQCMSCQHLRDAWAKKTSSVCSKKLLEL